MPPPDRQNATAPGGACPQWAAIFATASISLMSAWLAWPQFFSGRGAATPATLPMLSQRASRLGTITNLIQRDSLCISLAADARALDRALAPDARVFLSGVLGQEQGPRLGHYYFLRNYLFPREVNISLGQSAVYHEGWFEGVACYSPEVLRTNGYDVLLLMATNSDDVQFISLTQKGVPR